MTKLHSLMFVTNGIGYIDAFEFIPNFLYGKVMSVFSYSNGENIAVGL